MLADKHVFVSRKDKKFLYDGTAASLFGWTLGGILGHVYVGIQQEIDQGLIVREDAYQDRMNIENLLAELIDLTLMAMSTAQFLIYDSRLADQLLITPKPLNGYGRHILVQQGEQQLHKDINTFVKGLEGDPDWAALIAKYYLNKAVQP